MLEVLNKHLSQASNLELCSFGYWLETQDDKTKAAFAKIAEAKNISTQQLYNDLMESGADLPCKLTIFRSHMKGYCVCRKK